MPNAIKDKSAFILEHTECLPSTLVPEISLYLATDTGPLWRLTEEELADRGLPPPFWAFAWAGGQALARYILDNPELLRGKRIFDFASGSGLIGIAAARSGAGYVAANDIDPFAHHAMELNARANNVTMAVSSHNMIGHDLSDFDIILTGDICYEQPLADEVEIWLRGIAASGRMVLMGDPGRTYRPKQGLEKCAHYHVPTPRELEDNDVRSTSVWRILPLDTKQRN